MIRRSKPSSPNSIREELLKTLSEIDTELKDIDLRVRVLELIPAFHQLRDLGSSIMGNDMGSAVERIIHYLRLYPKRIIHGDEIMVISGIGEWARRVRQLRVECGWSIASGNTLKEMADADSFLLNFDGRNLSDIKPDEYVLLDEVCDRDAAYRWKQANSIRKLKALSTQDKILRFLRENVGKPITGEELKYVAGNKSEWARRLRELRTEEGWPIATRTDEWPHLSIGTYVLLEDRQAPVHDRHIPDKIRIAVLERDMFSCKKCGWNVHKKMQGDPRRFLELHHKKHHVLGGENTVDNLVTLCNVHHDIVHADELDIDEFLKDSLIELN